MFQIELVRRACSSPFCCLPTEVNIEEKGKGVLVTARQGVTHAMLNGGHSVEEHGDNTSAALTAEEDLRAQAYFQPPATHSICRSLRAGETM